MFWGLALSRRLGLLLPRPLLGVLSAVAAVAAYAALPGKRANMRRNLRVVLAGTPDAGTPAFERRVRGLARRSMHAYCRTLLDFMSMPRLLPRVFADTERIPGWEHLETALAQGRGVVFATAHFGHWDLAGAVVARRFPPGTVFAVVEEFAHPRLNEMVAGERGAYGLGGVPMENVRRMVRVLREGKILGILVDRPVGASDGVPVRFFGQWTQLPAGAAALASMARCPIVPGYLLPRSDGRFEAAVLPPIEPVRTGNRDADLAATMQRVVVSLETIIRRSPHQWFMFRDMWPGETINTETRRHGEGYGEIMRRIAPWGTRLRRARLALAVAFSVIFSVSLCTFGACADRNSGGAG